MSKEFNFQHHLNNGEVESYQALVKQLHDSPIPDNEILANMGLFLNRSSLARILFFSDLYKNILNNHGVIMEFGVRWGQTLNLMSCLRSMYEPFNTSRKIIGFDTFSGFPSVSDKDGSTEKSQVGNYSVPTNYEKVLEQHLHIQESLNPKANVKKFELVKGDVSQTLPDYLSRHPETILSLVYFDLDLYEPTKFCLEQLLPYCHKNTIFAFDELCYTDFPGETLALREVFQGREYEIIRSPISPQQSYVVLV
ncbi:hypothetical protein KO505_05680 [Psychrosphaera sp. F3M07]|uniref:TylF/MycF/NovP-related O-methyltransferase n=1 Tax=Psychrosphaera sp. F3M07 TaxID=2841560 RepID=UPI001C09707E|nr:TylF/MycF/NovP-related O-methyltransferase [Psychrosphaera sp. F3M07]MBU2917453.1 hypothetical protein [Psychrosphaera sp. F3M07]